MIVPVSSLGTIPVGVVFMKKIKRAIATTTSPNERTDFWMKNNTFFLYRFRIDSYVELNAFLNLSVVIPNSAKTLMMTKMMHNTGCSLKLNIPEIIPIIAMNVKINVILGWSSFPIASV